jgi:nucleoside-diphosphate-sugar epimerase
MRALVTGSAGFIGRNFVSRLRADGYDVTTVDIAYPGVRSMDCRTFFACDTSRYDLVVHCAAVIPDRQQREDHPLAIAENLELDSAMFRWALRTRPAKVVYFSSCAAYPLTILDRPMHESDINLDDPRGPDALYGWEKLTGEILARAAAADGLDVTVFRPFSGYGTDQSLDYPSPSFIARARDHADPFDIWGDGAQVRDWIHVDDIVGAVLAAIRYHIGGPINLGWGEPVSMGELVMQVCEAAGYTPRINLRLDAPTGARWRVADAARMLSFYAPTVTLEEGIRRALDRFAAVA